MSSSYDIEASATRIRDALAAHLGTKGRTLDKAVSQAGRRLPKPLRTDALKIAKAVKMAGNPKLVRQVGPDNLQKAEAVIMEHLTAINKNEERRNRRLNLAAVIAFNLLIVLVAFVAWIYWSGTAG
ncbi:MAG: hypothetical protein AAF729_12085 [Pseudomonadota bacterium]